jgi:hypothetical protein
MEGHSAAGSTLHSKDVEEEWITVGAAPKLTTGAKIGSAADKKHSNKKGISAKRSQIAKEEALNAPSNPPKRNVNSTTFIARPSTKRANSLGTEGSSLFVNEFQIPTNARGRFIGDKGTTCKTFATHFQVTITITPSNDKPNEQFVTVESSSNEANLIAIEAINVFLSTGRTPWSKSKPKAKDGEKSNDTSKNDLTRPEADTSEVAESFDVPLAPVKSNGPTWSSIAKSMPLTAPVSEPAINHHEPSSILIKKTRLEKKVLKQKDLTSQRDVEKDLVKLKTEAADNSSVSRDAVPPIVEIDVVAAAPTIPAPASSWAGKVRGSST